MRDETATLLPGRSAKPTFESLKTTATYQRGQDSGLGSSPERLRFSLSTTHGWTSRHPIETAPLDPSVA